MHTPNSKLSFSPKSSALFLTLISLTIFALAFLMNHNTTRLGDDYLFSLYPHGTNYSFFELISDAIKKAYYNYFFDIEPAFCFRVIEKIFCTVPKFYANIAHASMLTALCYLVYRHINAHKPSNSLIYLISSCTIMLTTPLTCQSIFWLSGAFTYLWPVTFALLFLLPYRLNETFSNSKWFIFSSIGMFILGLFAGMGHGGAGPLCCSISLCFIILWFYQKVKTPIWAYTGFFGACIGFSIYLFSPSNANRARMFEPTPYLQLFIKKSILIITNTEAIIFVFCMILFIFLYKRKDKLCALANNHSLLYFIGAFATVFAMSFTPMGVRSLLFFSTFLTIISCILFFEYFNQEIMKKALPFIAITLLFLYLPQYASDLFFAKDCKNFMQQCENHALTEKAKGNLHIKLPSIQNRHAYVALYCRNVMEGLVGFPHYFGIKKVDIVTLDQEDNIYSINPVELAQEYSLPPKK